MYVTYQTHMDPLDKAHKTSFSWFFTIWFNPHKFCYSNAGKLPIKPHYQTNLSKNSFGLLKQLYKHFFKQLSITLPEIFWYFIIGYIFIWLNPRKIVRNIATIWLNPQKPCWTLGHMTKMWMLAYGVCTDKMRPEMCTVVLKHIFWSYDLTGTPGALIGA